jgi:hypothetical protein
MARIQGATVFPRAVAADSRPAAATFLLVVLRGARQVGKTALARSACARHRDVNHEGAADVVEQLVSDARDHP